MFYGQVISLTLLLILALIDSLPFSAVVNMVSRKTKAEKF